jgi:hypothetical protein
MPITIRRLTRLDAQELWKKAILERGWENQRIARVMFDWLEGKNSLQRCIGTSSAAVHPERPTASDIYQRKGKTTMRARIDLGFGHRTDNHGIVGAVELKALRSFDVSWFRNETLKVATTPRNVMFSGLAGDFQKVLDPQIPDEAFRCSWAVTRQRAGESSDEISNLAAALLLPVEQRLSLEHTARTVDVNTGWLRFEWEKGMSLHL